MPIYRALAVLALLLAGCAPVREAPPFVAVAKEPASISWQQGTRVSVRKASFEKSSDGAVRMTVEGKPAARQFLLQPDGMFSTEGWEGQVGAAPPGLSIWASFLTIYQNVGRLPVGDRELHTPSVRIAVRKTDKGLESVAIRSLDTAESLSAVFKPKR